LGQALPEPDVGTERDRNPTTAGDRELSIDFERPHTSFVGLRQTNKVVRE
jgi:hypothetical protein